MKKLFLLSLLALGSCSHNNQKVENQEKLADKEAVGKNFDTPKTLNEAINSPYRTPLFKERDVYRHPEDTLTFFKIKPTMEVLEVTPGTGWYSEILAPFLNDKGQYVMANHAANSPAPKSNHFGEWSKKHPEIANNIKSTVFDLSNPNLELGEEFSMDAVLTFRNVHNWMAAGKEDVAFRAFYKVLKKGGLLGVVEHRASKDSNDLNASKGYVKESDVIKMARKAGFKYLGKSEVNMNPKDTKDYEKGVWSLPPTLVNKDQDREKYMAIGESDRMTLKFIKP